MPAHIINLVLLATLEQDKTIKINSCLANDDGTLATLGEKWPHTHTHQTSNWQCGWLNDLTMKWANNKMCQFNIPICLCALLLVSLCKHLPVFIYITPFVCLQIHLSVNTYVIYVSVCQCICHICLSIRLLSICIMVCPYVRMSLCVCPYLCKVCPYVLMHVWISYKWTYIHLYVRLPICGYVLMHVWTCIYIYGYHTNRHTYIYM